MRDRPAQPASSGRGTGRSATRRRDAARALCGCERAPPPGRSTAAHYHMGERARWRVGWRRRRRFLPRPLMAATAPFCSAGIAGQPSDAIRRPAVDDRLVGPNAAQEGKGGAPRRAGLAARPSAVGPKGGALRTPSGLGRFCAWAALTVTVFVVFSFSRSIFNSFLNAFVYSFASGNRNSYMFPLLSLYSCFYTLIRTNETIKV